MTGRRGFRPPARSSSAKPTSRSGAARDRSGFAAVLVLAAAVAIAAPAVADWLTPDASVREAQMIVRMAARDTTGHGDDPARLDSLAVAHLRLGNLSDAAAVFRRVIAVSPADDFARAGLGKIALFEERPAEAESLLAAIAVPDPNAKSDRFAALVRLGRYDEAAELAGQVNLAGRAELLRRLQAAPPYDIAAGPAEVTIPFTRAYPTPLVKVLLNGERVLMAIDTGTQDLLIDDVAFRRLRIPPVGGEYTSFWSGTRVAVRGALVPRLEIGGFRIENCPAGVLNLGRWSREVNPQFERVAGIIGLGALRRFSPTIDLAGRVLVLRRPGAPLNVSASAVRIPFQTWGESELTVRGTIAEGRPMAFVLATGLPGGAIGAPASVLEEAGIRAGVVSRAQKGLGGLMMGRTWAAAQVPSVTVGGVSRSKLQGWSGAMDTAELWRHGVRRDAVLGGEFFRGRKLTFDWAARELIVEE
jgi:hypothetical protein